jgi:hypothetical protein
MPFVGVAFVAVIAFVAGILVGRVNRKLVDKAYNAVEKPSSGAGSASGGAGGAGGFIPKTK